MTTKSDKVAPITGQTAKVGETFNRNRYEVHSRAQRPGAVWMIHSRKADTLTEAREQVKEAKKGDHPIMVEMIGPGPKMDFRIVQVTASCKVVE